MEDPIVDELAFSLNDKQKIKRIREEVAFASKQLRNSYPILHHQNAIGMAIMLLSVAMITIASYLFLQGIISGWLLLFWNAFWMSILHELEHDTIHYMYFKKHPLIQNFMLAVIWVMRPTTINPWYRRHIHFYHHRFSGTTGDVEERGVTNGERWGIRRLLGTPDLLLGGIMRAARMRQDIITLVKEGKMDRDFALLLKKMNAFGFLPFGILVHIIWYIFILHYAIHGITDMLGIEYNSPAWLQSQFSWLQPLVVIWIAPNFLRQLCLHFITSNMHYYGDVESGNIIQQTQVLNVWWLLPFQLFCFNFGSTHAIHHFVVGETFYIRQLTASAAHKVMREMGVRFNDIGTFKRANRWQLNYTP